MGEFVTKLSHIGLGYNIHIVVIGNVFGTTPQKVINETFEQIAYSIGEKNVISKVISQEGLEEAEKKFGIKYEDRRPILLIMDKHPDKLQDGDKIIKIQLGPYEDNTDKLKDDLLKLSLLVKDAEFSKILWEERKKKILSILKAIPYVDIVTTALGYAKS